MDPAFCANVTGQCVSTPCRGIPSTLNPGPKPPLNQAYIKPTPKPPETPTEPQTILDPTGCCCITHLRACVVSSRILIDKDR